ncbi:taste receptor type 1 member 1-like [Pholidichthys leucotaenia]
MRFTVEEINNSTDILPNVPLGYEIFDDCTDTGTFPGPFDLISVNGLIQPSGERHKNSPKVTYGASSSIFSRKINFPSFLRTSPPNQDVIHAIVDILQHFNWSWVSFLHIDDDYGRDGLDWFRKTIEDTEICLAYTKGLNHHTDYQPILRQINELKVNAIIVYSPEWTAEDLIDSVVQLNMTNNNKVWIAGYAWSLNKKIRDKIKGKKAIGTILGVAEPQITIPGFKEFIHAFKAQDHYENEEQERFCNQKCNCSSVSAEEIIQADPAFSFPVYAAVYAVAHALHKILQCESGSCNDSIRVSPQMVLAELRKTRFELLNRTIQFDKNGDPKFGFSAIVLWNQHGDVQESLETSS